jgi:hypothetical protein
MAIMCEECKCSIYLEEQEDGTKEYGGCENNCPCCNKEEGTSTISEVLAKRNAQVLAVTDEDRDEMDENNPIVFAESGPNRFSLMSMFFEDKVGGDNDGVQIQEDLDCGEITVKYFTEEGEVELTEGAVYEWAINHYRENF